MTLGLIIRTLCEFLAMIGILVMYIHREEVNRWENRWLAKIFKIDYNEEEK